MRLVLFLLPLVLLFNACSDNKPLSRYTKIDLVIQNARIIDGANKPAYNGNIYIVDDSIVHISPDLIESEKITRLIDANGRLVTPGFIDLHSHGDPLKTPEFNNFIAMGVTTISLGQDGFSPAVAHIDDWLTEIKNGGGITPNLIPFIGHGTLRRLSGVGEAANPSKEQIEAMDSLLQSQLESVFGMSTGLEYNPGLYATSDELRQLALTLGKNNKMIMSHMRNEDDDQLIQSIDELLSQGKETQVHIAHLKSVYGQGKDRANQILDHLKEARSRGVEVTADLYPYNASYTGISIVFPEWCKTTEQFELVKQNRLEELREYLRMRVNKRNGPEATLLGTPPFTGMTLLDLADSLDKPFEDVLIEDIGPSGASGAYFVMDSDLQNRLAQADFVAIASDGSPTGFHPRGHGTFARLIETMTLKDELFPLATAVYKATGLPAAILGLTDRGIVTVGAKADLLVFDEELVREKSTYPNPHQLATGFDYVIINGTVVKEGDQIFDVRPGVVLKK